ncbi:MAG: response regulator [Magnetococcales bacterium]|nr:response regulator [Magnetococcales bacterium]
MKPAIVIPDDPEELRRLLLQAQEELDRREVRLHEQTVELESCRTALDEARIQAAIALRAKNHFLDNMGHEIRTPMNAIIGMTDLVLASQLEPQQRKLLEVVLRASESLLNILNDILDFSRVEVDQLNLDHIPCPVRPVVEHAITTIVVDAELKGLTLLWEIAPAVPERILGDPVRLRQVLIHLLSNAVKFTHAGGVQLRVGRQEEGLGCPWLVFEIQDSGIGIPEDRLAMIFDGFSQVDDRLTRRVGGTGLGLALSRKLVERMGGTLEVRSRPGAGSEFIFRVPCDLPTGDERVRGGLPAVAGGEVTAAAERREMRILLVEDDPDNRMLAQHVLTSAGYSVTTAGDGEEALRCLNQGCDLVFMDIQMPRLNGIETTRRIRAGKEKADPDMPIIGVSGHVQEQLRTHCLEAGMDAFLTKPYRARDLLDRVASAGELRARRLEQRRLATPGHGRHGERG